MSGQWTSIKAKDGGEFRAYTALPAKGTGPGLVLLQEIFGVNQYMRDMADYYAEEGYVVMVPDLFWRMKPGIDLGYGEADFKQAIDYLGKFDVDKSIDDVAATLDAMRKHPAHRGKVGALGYCLGGRLAFLTAARTDVDCAIGYYAVTVENYLEEAKNIKVPFMLHFAELDHYCPTEVREKIIKAFEGKADAEMYSYPNVDHAFATPERPVYHKPSAMMAYSRSLAMLRRTMGPHYDFNSLWDEHCYHEFVTRNPDKVMPTMVPQPYVNHVPTMTGGVGHDQLKRFYTHHFVNANPEDTRLIPISRTIGSDRVVDEFIFACTHTREIDWLIPGIPPTGKPIEIPMLGVISFRGDKLYNEHIYWDQASVLVQIGKLDPTGLPVAGAETTRKLLDPSLPSNTLMPNWKSSEGKPF